MQEEFGYFISYIVDNERYYNDEIIHKLIESKEDISEIEIGIQNTLDCKSVIILHYRMF